MVENFVEKYIPIRI